MAIYRITRFTSSDMDRAMAKAEEAREEVSAVGAELIDLAADADGNGVVIAKYPDAATMEAATATAQKVFGQLVAEGLWMEIPSASGQGSGRLDVKRWDGGAL